MIESISYKTLNDSIHFHSMVSKKFKTDFISFNFARPLTEFEATCNTLLARVLERGSAKYPDINALSNKLDSMYGAYLGVDSSKIGERHVLEVKVGYLSNRFIPIDLEMETLQLIEDIICNPLLENGVFDENVFIQEVKNLRDDILARENEKVQYSIERCIEIVCEDESYKIHSLGSIDVLDKLTSSILYEHYKNVISNSVVDIIAIGSYDNDKIIDKVKQQFGTKIQGTSQAFSKEKVDTQVKNKRVDEYFEVQQSKIAIGYKSGIAFDDSRYEALMIMSGILGGGANSLLFSNIREKESLCYYIFSTVDKFKGLIVIGAGVESDKVSKTLELIDINVEMMRNGEFSDDNLNSAKLRLVSAVDSVSDSASSYANFFYNYALFDMVFSPEDYKERINSVSRQDVIDAAKAIVKDTTYVLDSQK